MKKIVGAVLAATLAAGVATAEVTVKLDSATKMDALNVQWQDPDTTVMGEFTIFTENKFTLDAKNDAGTVGLSFTPKFNSMGTPAVDYQIKSDSWVSATGDAQSKNKDVMKASTNGLFCRIEWNAFVKGKYAKVTVGNFDSRNANRVVTDAGKYHKWEYAKLGYSKFSATSAAINGALGYSVVETDDITRSGDTCINAVGDLYVGPATIQLAYRQKKATGAATEDVKYFAGNWALRVFGNVKDFVKLTATLTGEDEHPAVELGKTRTNRNTKLDLGVFAEITALKKVGTFLVGYSGGYSIYDGTSVVSGLKADTSVHAINTRIRIPLMDNKLSITTHNDFSFGTMSYGPAANKKDSTKFNMFNMLALTYKVNNVFTPQIFFANNLVTYEDATGKNADAALIIAPRCQFALAKGANFYASFEYRVRYAAPNAAAQHYQSSLQIPMVLHVAL